MPRATTTDLVSNVRPFPFLTARNTNQTAAILIRNLVNLYRTTTNKDIKREIKGFVNLNFNNLYNLARSGDDYDGDWRGPFVCATSWGQLVAIDLLVAALAVN